MIALLSNLELMQYIKAKKLVIMLLLLTYGASCLVSPFLFMQERVFIVAEATSVHTPENSSLSFSIPLSTEKESSESEDNFSQDDENFTGLPSILFFRCTDSILFYHLNNSILSSSFNPPFSPPEIESC